MDASTLRTGPSGAALASASKASTEIPGGQRQRRSKNSKETRTVNTNKYIYQLSNIFKIKQFVCTIYIYQICTDLFFGSFPRVPWSVSPLVVSPRRRWWSCWLCGRGTGLTEDFKLLVEKTWENTCYIILHYITLLCSIMSYRDHIYIYLIIHPSIYFIYSISAGMRHEYENETGRSLVTSLSSIMSHTMMKWINTNIASLFSGTYRKGTLERLLGGAWTRHYWSIIQYHPDYAKDAPG